MKRIQKEREERNMTQTDLAFELRIQPARISRIESGKHYPYKPSQEKLEKFFNMSISVLLKEVE